MKNILDYGADKTGAIDSYNAINKAINDAYNSGDLKVYIPSGTYLVSQKIIMKPGVVVQGDGMFNTTLKATNDDEPVIAFPDYVNGSISDCGFDRSVAAVAGGHGVEFEGRHSHIRLSNLRILNQWHGLKLKTTDFSIVTDIQTENNYGDGIYISNHPNDGQAQWSLNKIFATKNNGAGIRFKADDTGTATATTSGQWDNIITFANTGGGVRFEGSEDVGIFDIRLSNGFLGGDSNDELYVDSYGGKHLFSNLFLEYSGKSVTGRNVATAISNVGRGITLTENNDTAQLINIHADANSYTGLYSKAKNVIISGGQFINSGTSLVTGERSGIHIAGGAATISGVRSKNDLGNSMQQYGVLSDVDNIVLTGSKVANNSVAGIHGSVTLSKSRIGNNDVTFANTFTPTVYGSTTAGSPTYNYSAGRWVKNGSEVTLYLSVSMSNKGGMAGVVLIGLPSMPFTPKAGVNYPATVGYVGGTTVSAWQVKGVLLHSQNYITMYNGGAGLQDTNITDTFNFDMTVKFEVD